jgi:hypothetical protein
MFQSRKRCPHATNSNQLWYYRVHRPYQPGTPIGSIQAHAVIASLTAPSKIERGQAFRMTWLEEQTDQGRILERDVAARLPGRQ